MGKYFEVLDDRKINLLYAFQEEIYSRIMDILAPSEDIALIGCTALARCYLKHRVSFDLDFAVNPSKDVLERFLSVLSNKSIFKIRSYSIGREGFYDNAFLTATGKDIAIEFSFIQDRKYGNFKFANKKMGDICIITVTLDTLYYNKLRTIADDFESLNRNKIRDVFDLAVLSNDYIKLNEFIEKVSADIDFTFSADSFYESLIGFDWVNIEGQCIYPLNDWRKIDSIEKLIDCINNEADLVYEKDNYW